MRKKLSERLRGPVSGLLLLATMLPALAQRPPSFASTAKPSENPSSRSTSVSSELIVGRFEPDSSLVTVPRVALEGLIWDNRRLYTRVRADSAWFQVRLDSMARRLAGRQQEPAGDQPDIFSRPVVFIGGFILGAIVTMEIAESLH